MMNNGKPSVLKMSEDKKQETVNTVYEAIGILNKKMKESRQCWSETWKVTKRATTHTITMVNNSHKYMGASVSLIVGSSQQRRLKRHIRRSDVWLESRRIANKTGANFDEVKDLYFKLMNLYIDSNP